MQRCADCCREAARWRAWPLLTWHHPMCTCLMHAAAQQRRSRWSPATATPSLRSGSMKCTTPSCQQTPQVKLHAFFRRPQFGLETWCGAMYRTVIATHPQVHARGSSADKTQSQKSGLTHSETLTSLQISVGPCFLNTWPCDV